MKKPRKQKQKFDLAAYFAQRQKEEEEEAKKRSKQTSDDEEGESTPSGPIVPKIFMQGPPGSGKGII